MRKGTSRKTQETRLKIERQEIIKEIQTKSYEVVRLSKVKYLGNDYDFIDIRIYRRGWDERGSEEVYYPTKQGVQLKDSLFRILVDEHFLHSLEEQIKRSDSEK